jgi:carboxyl-terminal processing protease
VDRFSGSAAEDFILPFLENGRATIIGERTYGSTGQPLIRNFDDGNIVVMVGAIRSFLPNGDSFEGIGIVPNLEVTMRREDLYQQHDVALEKALEFLRS